MYYIIDVLFISLLILWSEIINISNIFSNISDIIKNAIIVCALVRSSTINVTDFFNIDSVYYARLIYSLIHTTVSLTYYQWIEPTTLEELWVKISFQNIS